MKYDLQAKAFGCILTGMIKKGVQDKMIRKNIKEEYRKIILRAKDIGSGNRLIASYYLAAFFMGMNRNTGLTAEENIKIMEQGMTGSRMVKAFLGNPKTYFSEKNMESRREWSRQTHERKYENDWVVDVIEKGDDFQFGFDYLECGVCKLCRDEGCPELAKYLCRLDYLLVDIIGIHLERTMTIAEGYEKCDFRFIK